MIEKGINQTLEKQVIKGISIPDREDYDKERREQVKKANRSSGNDRERRKGTDPSTRSKTSVQRQKGKSASSSSGREELDKARLLLVGFSLSSLMDSETYLRFFDYSSLEVGDYCPLMWNKIQRKRGCQRIFDVTSSLFTFANPSSSFHFLWR